LKHKYCYSGKKMGVKAMTEDDKTKQAVKRERLSNLSNTVNMKKD